MTPPISAKPRQPSLATLVLLSAISPLAINIFVPSIPGMAREFGVAYSVIQLGLSLFLAMIALVQLAVAPLSDFFGRRPVVIAGMALFVAGTLLSLFAPTAFVFLVGRTIQAAGAIGIVLGRAIVRDLFPQDRAASMIGYVTMAMAVAPMVAPAIGGILDDAFGWRASFWLLLAAGLFALAVAVLDLPETNTGRGRPAAEQFAAYGAMIGSGRFWLFTLSSSFASAVFFFFLGGAPAIASTELALSTTSYGIWSALCALGYMIGNFASGRYSERFGVNRMVLTGALLTLAGACMPFAADLAGAFGAVPLFAPMLLVGAGNGLTLPNATAGAVSVRPDAAGAAAGLSGAIQIGFGAVASVVAGILVSGPRPVMAYAAAMFGIAVAGAIVAAICARRR